MKQSAAPVGFFERCGGICGCGIRLPRGFWQVSQLMVFARIAGVGEFDVAEIYTHTSKKSLEKIISPLDSAIELKTK